MQLSESDREGGREGCGCAVLLKALLILRVVCLKLSAAFNVISGLIAIFGPTKRPTGLTALLSLPCSTLFCPASLCPALLQENITRLANYRRVQLEESLTANDASVPSFMSLVKQNRTIDYRLLIISSHWLALMYACMLLPSIAILS